tara:strand:- start:107 stop:223 length:117 start_codon:yes stop_codon:yes gene_type:complete
MPDGTLDKALAGADWIEINLCGRGQKSHGGVPLLMCLL